MALLGSFAFLAYIVHFNVLFPPPLFFFLLYLFIYFWIMAKSPLVGSGTDNTKQLFEKGFI